MIFRGLGRWNPQSPQKFLYWLYLSNALILLSKCFEWLCPILPCYMVIGTFLIVDYTILKINYMIIFAL